MTREVPDQGVDSPRYAVYIDSEEDREMEFKGYDFGELLDAFGLREQYQNNQRKIQLAEDILEELPTFEEDELDAEMIRKYAWDHVDNYEDTLDPAVKDYIVAYLKALRDEEHVSNGTFLAADMLLEMAKEEDDMEFVAWFSLMLPRLWT